jgi:cold shock CspA family protein
VLYAAGIMIAVLDSCALIVNEDGSTKIDLDQPETFIHISQLKKSGLQPLAERDVVSRTGKIEAANVRPAR